MRVDNPSDAEDIAAQIFIKVYTAFPPDNRGTFRAWLFTIAHHSVVNYYRRQQAHGQTRSLDCERTQQLRDRSASPEDLALQQDDRRMVADALVCLTHDQRQVIELRLSGLRGVEAATVVGRSENAVKMLPLRAIARLRSALTDSNRYVGTTIDTSAKEHADAS